MMKKLLLFFCILFSISLSAQNLYWVGGSGYWNDGNHWSNTSGGLSVHTIPSLNSNIIFDNNSSSSGSFTIHATNSFIIKSLTANNNQFNVDIISSPTVDMTFLGKVELNEYFYLKTNGNIYLKPTSDVIYQFSHNKLNNDVFVTSSNSVQFGTVTILKTLFLKGNLVLKNSIVLTENLEVNNANLELNHNTIQAKGTVELLNSNIANNTSQKTKLICKKNTLTLAETTEFSSASNVSISPLAPTSGGVTLVGFTNPTCSGLCNGTATFDLSGFSDPPYVIQWVNGDPSPPCQVLPPAQFGYASTSYSVNTLCGCGTQYSVLFENAIGEIVVVQVGITNPTATLLTFSQTQPTCFGLCNGQIRINIFSGVPTFTVNWNPPNVNHVGILARDTLKNLCTGTYTLNITNNNGCINTFTTILNQPAILVPNGSSSSITCNSFCNGSASVAPTGGTAGYTYVWNPAAATPTSNINSGLCPGVVTVTVTDTKTCTAVYSTTITQPPAITLTVTKADLTCGSVCNGTASITALGGSGIGYTYTWTPSVSVGSSAVALCAGFYTVDVTDNLLCLKTVTFQIIAPPSLTATPTQTNINCNLACTGAINLNPSGGTPGYSFIWSPLLPATSTVSALCSGVYSYTITDALLCKFSNSVTITQPPAITLTIVSTSITCFGACDGLSASSLSGGTAPYTYTWTPGIIVGQGTGTVSSLCPANYTLNITDNLGCVKQATTAISQPIAISLNTSSVIPSCNGICDGSINSIPSGGVGPFTFTLQPSVGLPTVGPAPFNALCAGLYTLTVRDNVGCIQTQTINLTQPNPISLTLNSTSITCAGQCNASIATVVSGGSPAYTFLWNTGSVASFLAGQCAGVYSATVTDVFGCKSSTTTTIVAPQALTVTIVPTNPNCFAQCTGIATATVSGGTPGYTINWTNGDVGNISSNLCQGTYTATVTDLLGCIQTQTVPIVTPPAITLTATNGTVTCAASCDGTVSVTPSGGTPGYIISWNSIPTQSTNIASGLCVGNYVASITDSKGCVASTPASVIQPIVLTATITNVIPSCNICIGAATAAGIGGVGPYTYSWSPSGQITPTAINLCVGIHTVDVTDSKGCVVTQTVQISQTVIVLVTSNGSTLTCNGGCTGVATANAVGGLLPYTYTWTTTAPLQTAATATALCAGTYTVLVKDANGCSNTDQITFINPPAITLTVNQTSVTCSGLCNGSATATAVGGTGAINYLWQPGGLPTPIIGGLCPGGYTVAVTDANSCSQTQVINITPSSSVTATFTNINPSGCIATNGSITHTLTGGAAPVTFTWVPGGSVNPLINLTDGIYVLNTRDGNGCVQSFTTTLSDPLSPTVTATSNSVTCFGLCNGSATISVSGAGPFSVNWPTIPSISNTVSALCSGVYVVQVTDINVCVTNQTVNIAQPSQITSSGIVTNVTCGGACTGSINLTPLGGTPAYTYNWIPAGGVGQDPTNLCLGNYTVNISDANLCVVSNTFIITQPSSTTLTISKTDVLCNGNCTGTASVTAIGGTGPYTFSWTPVGAFPGSALNNIINLCTGIYSVSVRDFNGCVVTGTVSIGQPTALTSTVVSISNLCSGLCNGSATLTASGGVGPYSFSYNTFPVTFGSTVGSLCSGSYVGTVSDFNSCVSSQTFVITQPLPIVVTATVSNPRCNAVCNGSVATTVTGGTPGYNYLWFASGGAVPNPTGLCAGNYTVNVTDANLCTGQALVVLINPPSLIANTSFTNVTCGGICNGIVSANPIGGTGPMSYSWTAPTNTTQTVSGLCAGNYTLTVTDANLCQDTQTLTLIAPPPISLNPAITPANCGVSNGVIIAVPTTTVSNPYTYNWLPPLASISATVSGLAAGVYTVVVTNAALCSATISIALSNSNGPTGSTNTFTDVACNGQCNGAASVSNPVGGTPSYTISWVAPAITNTLITGLCPGVYTSLIRDANNCLLFQNTTISQPLVIDDNDVLASATCFGICNGSIILNPTGGNGGYTYLWNTAATTSSLTSLCPGNYSVTILDSKNCSLVANYNLPSLISVTSSTFGTNNLCFNSCNGTLLALGVAGGLPPYSYNWSDPLGQSSPLAIGLCNGSYSVTVTDANGCFSVFPASVTSPSQVTFTPTITQPNCDLCNGSAVVNPVGGTPTYSITWSNTQTGTTASTLCAGVYGVQIVDGNGCVSLSNVVINSSSGITGQNISFTNTSCSGACDGSVTVTAVGGVAPIIYNWLHNGSPNQTQFGLCSGTYFCNMTDLNGCSRTASVVIGNTTTMTINSQVTQSSCFANTGSVVATVSGGSGVYTYLWLPMGAITSSVTGLASGTYTLNVSDGTCIITKEFVIGTINGPVITLSKKDITCSAACTGTASIVISGGTPGYTTLWSNGVATNTVIALCSGNYSVEVTDLVGCKAIKNFSVSNSPPILFSSPDLDGPQCNNQCNGALTAIPSGGTLPFVYSWTPTVSASPTISSLCGGVYSITITDVNGCSASQSYTLINPPTMTLTALVANASCNSIADGGVVITEGGGTFPHTYSWTPTANTTLTLSNVFSGTYSLSITDLGGCKKDTVITIVPTVFVNAIAGNDTTFCQNGTLLLNGSPSTGGITYQWFELPTVVAFSNTTIVSVTPATGTSTYVIVATNGLCIDSDTIIVNSNALPIVDAGPFVSIPLFATTPIGGSPTGPAGSVFNWFPIVDLTSNSVSNPTSSTTITTTYTVNVTDANGCAGSDTVTVFVYPEVIIPNGFTPNGDGKNDTWQLDLITLFPNNEVEVYNRWGEQLFYSKGYSVPFNGQYKGKDLPVGTYYYVIKLNHPAYPDAYTGPLTIFR